MNNTSTPTRRPRKNRRAVMPWIVAVILAVLLSAIVYYWSRGELSPDQIASDIVSLLKIKNDSDHEQAEQTSAATAAADRTVSGGNAELTTGKARSESANNDTPPVAQQQGNGAATGSGDIVSLDDSPAAAMSEKTQEMSGEELAGTGIRELNDFYSHLDAQQYMKQFNLPQPSKDYFSNLIQKLLDNPPVVTRETDDLFTLLKNTAHFFRILGKENIIILKGILDREKNSFEQILQTFYELTKQPEYLKKEYGIVIPEGALHDYAGFFLNTMGGRLYLFRRDSLSRLAVSYYSILIVDKAISDGNGRHGIDLRPAIDSLIDELENGGDRLRLKQTYLDKLYDLQQKYAR